MIYIASPYTHPDPAIRDYRYQMVHAYTHQCMQRGEVVFSPIVYGHEFVQYDEAAITHDYWQHFNRAILQSCESLRVYRLPGWKESVGIDAEMAYARHCFLYIEHVNSMGVPV